LLGPSAPGIAHNWHMPGHTYSALKRYADAAWQQEASARVDHAHMIRFHLMPDEIHNYAHNNGWLVEDLVHLGRAREAVALAKNLIELPRIPRSPSGINTPAQDWRRGGSGWAEGRRRLLDALLELELWDDVLRLEKSSHLEPSGDFDEDLRIAHLTALAHFQTGDQLGGLRKVVALFEQERALQKERDDAGKTAREKALAEKKSESDAAKDADAARRPIERRIGTLRDRLGEVLVAQKLAAGEIDAAKKQLGELKGVPDVRLARYHAAVGDHEKAVEPSKKASESAVNQVAPLASHVAILTAAGKESEARTAFERLRDVGGSADPDLPVFRRLPLARGDWRRPAALASDLGERPPLDQLGPAYWHPPAAPAWTARFPDGRTIGSPDLRGKPHVLVFYLGKGCAHCMEQLGAFAPKAADFEAAGLRLIALSTDTPEGLGETVDESGKPFPFPLASDADLAAFKAFRAFDDFEARPLHSTVVVDGAGLIRWQHTSFNPFMKPEFVIEEAKRLLKFAVAGPSVAAQ
jgi:peroxiredoxin